MRGSTTFSTPWLAWGFSTFSRSWRVKSLRLGFSTFSGSGASTKLLPEPPRLSMPRRELSSLAPSATLFSSGITMASTSCSQGATSTLSGVTSSLSTLRSLKSTTSSLAPTGVSISASGVSTGGSNACQSAGASGIVSSILSGSIGSLVGSMGSLTGSLSFFGGIPLSLPQVAPPTKIRSKLKSSPLLSSS